MSDKSRLYGLISGPPTSPPERLEGESDSEYLARMLALVFTPEGPYKGHREGDDDE